MMKAQVTVSTDWLKPPLQHNKAVEIVLAAGHANFTTGQRKHFSTLCQATKPADWEQIFLLAATHSMRSLLWHHLAREDLVSCVDSEVWESERGYYRLQLLAQMRLVHTLHEALTMCTAAGIRAMPRKGPALGLRIYGTLGPRPSKDLDLLIDCRSGERHAYRVLAPLFEKWEARGIRVELAWSLIHRLPYRAAFDPCAIWNRATPSEFQGVPCFALHPRDELRYLCAHHIIHHEANEWLWLVDIAELLRRYEQDDTWDWSCFVDECIATQTALPTLLAFTQAQTMLDAPIPDKVLALLSEAAQARAEQLRWAATHTSLISIKKWLAVLHAARSVGELQTMVRTALWPDLTHLREYHNWVPGKSAVRVHFHRMWRFFAEVLSHRPTSD